jgi:selenocysteine-specific elongation factor
VLFFVSDACPSKNGIIYCHIRVSQTLMKQITIGVAGHIDHGKTALVRALTGMETDRLKEEQQRGMSIVLGFAHWATPDGEIDLIDVPGHERFVHTMIAGATGIEAVLLVIAANELVMPQTREHLALTELLGVRKGIVVMTKSDLVPSGQERAWAETQVHDELHETFLQDASLFWTSAQTGEGLQELQCALQALLSEAETTRELPQCYLPIDRVFTMTGHGTVVTGTLHQGTLRVGQTVEIVPQRKRAEVRGLEVHGQLVSQAHPGWRVAVNLRGLKKDDVRRGDALASPESLLPTRLLDVELRLLPDARPLKRGQTVRLHYGTTDILARVHPLGQEIILPGTTAFVQLRLTDEVQVPVHERFVLRAVSPIETLGGGIILDAAPQRHRDADADARQNVKILTSGSPAEKIHVKLLEAGVAGQTAVLLAARLGLPLPQVEEALGQMPVVSTGNFILLQSMFNALCDQILNLLHQFHADHPTRQGMPRQDLRRRLPKTLAAAIFACLLDTMSQQQLLVLEDGLVREASFSPDAMLSPVERSIVADIEDCFRCDGLKPPSLSDIIGTDRRRKNLYHFLRESGQLIETHDRESGRVVVFHATAIAEAKKHLQHALSDTAGATVSELNQILGITRKYAIPLLEYLDAQGFTKRVGDVRVLEPMPVNSEALTRPGKPVHPLPKTGEGKNDVLRNPLPDLWERAG